MKERATLAVGLMSGTSLDGMDAALVRFGGPGEVTLLRFHVRSYSGPERALIESAIQSGGARDLALLHARIGEWAAEAVQAVLAEAGVRPMELEFIAFPGQTIWHEPPAVTWQLGEPALLAERFGVKVVSGFRGRDLVAGGQGAPLVPIADVLLFGSPDHARALLNIGGMANLSWVGRRAVEDGALAFDTGPGVAVVDAVTRLLRPDLPFDRDGQVAAQGRVNPGVLEELLADPFFRHPPPRSTGREHFGSEYASRLHQRVPGPDGVATAVALTVRSIADAFARWVPATPELLVSGGGVHHPGIMDGLRGALDGVAVRRFDEVFFPGDAKEAVAFALLGYLTLHGQPGNLPAATGARGRRVLGTITPA